MAPRRSRVFALKDTAAANTTLITMQQTTDADVTPARSALQITVSYEQRALALDENGFLPQGNICIKFKLLCEAVPFGLRCVTPFGVSNAIPEQNAVNDKKLIRGADFHQTLQVKHARYSRVFHRTRGDMTEKRRLRPYSKLPLWLSVWGQKMGNPVWRWPA